MINTSEKERKRKFEELFRTMFPKVKAFAQKILQSEDDAEDIAQDIFVKLWNTPEGWEDKDTWMSYIYTLTRNHVFNFLKHKSIVQNYQTQSEQRIDYYSNDAIHDELYAKELQLLIHLTIKNMPVQRRKVFCMSRIEEMSYADIAEKLGISIRTVERHIYLALNELKKVTLIFVLFIETFNEFISSF